MGSIEKNGRDDRFNREEMRELLKLFSSLGLTVAVGIAGFFLAGLWLDRWLTAEGWNTRGLVKLAGMLSGLVLSVFWAYLRIARHLARFARDDEDAADRQRRGGE